MVGKQMKGYLSGPMLGYSGENYPTFELWAVRLRERGHEVLSPHEVELPTMIAEEDKIAYYMRKDIEMVMKSDCLWMIPGWMYSLGAKIEVSVAMALRLPLYDVKSGELLDIRRIHQVVECGHGRRVTVLGNELTTYSKCEDCYRFPIYDDKFRMDAI